MLHTIPITSIVIILKNLLHTLLLLLTMKFRWFFVATQWRAWTRNWG